MNRRGKRPQLPLIVVLLLAVVLIAFNRFSPSDPAVEPTATAPAVAATAPPTATRPLPTGLTIPTPPVDEGLTTIHYDQLPPEAREVIQLIAQGGPFPYRQDGTTFQNRERLLPLEPAGYYREYTVETPGSPDRGARRIVAGAQGELYYTDDHYASFARVVP